MKFLLIVFSLFTISAQAKDFKLDKDTFLKRIDEGRISLSKTPVANIPESIKPQLIESQKKEYPNFQEEMWFVAYIDSDNFRYFVFYEWYGRGCIYGVSEPKKYQKGSDSANNAAAMKEYESYSKIDKKYCEKSLGIVIDNESLKGTNLYKFKGVSQ